VTNDAVMTTAAEMPHIIQSGQACLAFATQNIGKTLRSKVGQATEDSIRHYSAIPAVSNNH